MKAFYMSFSTQDLAHILHSNLSYKFLLPHFQKLLNSTTLWGSKWYEKEVKKAISSLTNFSQTNLSLTNFSLAKKAGKNDV